jgi:hypothetical protein
MKDVLLISGSVFLASCGCLNLQPRASIQPTMPVSTNEQAPNVLVTSASVSNVTVASASASVQVVVVGPHLGVSSVPGVSTQIQTVVVPVLSFSAHGQIGDKTFVHTFTTTTTGLFEVRTLNCVNWTITRNGVVVDQNDNYNHKHVSVQPGDVLNLEFKQNGQPNAEMILVLDGKVF